MGYGDDYGSRGDYNSRGMDDERGEYGDRGERGARGAFRRRKVCRFCTEKDAKIDYRDANGLKFFVSERGKIVPRRISGACAKHQRELALAIKRGRALAMVPFAVAV